MIEKCINIGDLLCVKIHATTNNFHDLSKRFLNIQFTDYYEFDIYYNEDTKFSIPPKGILAKPFRNSSYYVNEINGEIIAYSPAQNYSCENLIIRNKNKINILCKSDCDSKVLIRLVTELIIRKLLEKKYFPIHASCVVKNKEAMLFFGPKNSGKSIALLKHVFLDKSYLMSNDITFVGKEKGQWFAFGLPYDITVDTSFFYQLIGNKKNLIYQKNILKYGSNKIRFNVSDFVNDFNTMMIWHAPISMVNYVNLSTEKDYSENLNISSMNSIVYLKEYGKDNTFRFDDYLKLNDLHPEFDYETFAKEIQFNKMEGNILKKYLRRQ